MTQCLNNLNAGTNIRFCLSNQHHLCSEQHSTINVTYALCFATTRFGPPHTAIISLFLFYLLKGPAADTTDAPQLIVQPSDEDEEKNDQFFFYFSTSRSTGGMKLTGEYRSTRGKTCPTVTCPPQIPHGPARDRTLASAMRGRRLTA